jgi:hypothetical protein
MQDDRHDTAAECWEECGRAVDGTREHRRQDESQDGIKPSSEKEKRPSPQRTITSVATKTTTPGG